MRQLHEPAATNGPQWQSAYGSVAGWCRRHFHRRFQRSHFGLARWHISVMDSEGTMKAVFNDMQNHSSNLHGVAVHDRRELFAVFDGAWGREPFGCELEGEN